MIPTLIELKRRAVYRVTCFINELFCIHMWDESLIFGRCGEKTHFVVRHCLKCTKEKTLFAGNRKEYLKWTEEEREKNNDGT